MSVARRSNFLCWLSTRLQAQWSIHMGLRCTPAVTAILLLPLAAAASALPTPTLDLVQKKMAGMTVPFEANQGQFAPEVAFAARTFAGTVFVTRDGKIVHALAGKSEQETVAQKDKAATPDGYIPDYRSSKVRTPRGPGWSLVESLQGAGELTPAGSQPSATRVSRFAGGAQNKHSNIATFDRVAFGEAWPGVSVELSARGNNVEKLFTVAPGTDPTTIRMKVAGATRLRLGDEGSLIAATGNGEVAFTPPVAFQEIGVARTEVPVRYVLLADNGYRFEITGDYDGSQPLVIDPLLQSTYLGRSSNDHATALALDASGNVFIAGTTSSTTFPGTAGGAQPASLGGNDAFIARLSSNLATLSQATYLGGSGFDQANALAISTSGNVFVAGFTDSTNFPGTTGGVQPASGGVGEAFVARLSNNLATLVQATYLGGSGGESANALALDASGNVFVAGATSSANFPGTTGGVQPSRNGGVDVFIARVSSNLATLLQATYLGGSSDDIANALTLDASGNVFIAGTTTSTNFPGTTGGAQPASGGGSGVDAFVARLSNNLTTLVQATYLGGNGNDQASALALDASGNLFVAGVTDSANLPGIAGGAQLIYGGGSTDAFVARLSSNLATLVNATYLGGNYSERPAALALDASGNVFVAGSTDSTDFPGTTGGAQPSLSGGSSDDAFVARLSNSLATLVQATYLGGSFSDGANALALDGNGNVFIAGTSSSTNFPGTTGGAQPASGGIDDAFVAKLTDNLQGAGDKIFFNGFE